MNLDLLTKKLLAAARQDAPAASVPYAFEKRVMANLVAGRPADTWSEWGGALWRAAVPCLAVMLLAGTCSLVWFPVGSAHDTLDAALDDTVLAALDNPEEPW